MVELKENLYYIELYFDQIPPEKYRETLKIYGWKWISSKYCWSGRKTPENMSVAQLICKELNKPKIDPLQNKPKHIFTMENLMVRSNSFYCNIHHIVTDMSGEVSICDKKGNNFKCIFPIAYCASCDLYYVLEETYNELKTKGIILCQIMKYRDYIQYGAYNDTNFNTWKSMSPLRLWGYSVNGADGLSDIQRQSILERIIDDEIMSKDRLLSYLDFFIRIHKNVNESTLNKWKEDRQYISSYNINNTNRVYIDTIYIKFR